MTVPGQPTRARRSYGERWQNSAAPDVIAQIWIVPLGLAAIYLGYFLLRLHESIVAILWDSDYASGLTLTQTVAHTGSGGHTIISTTGAYIPLWFGLLTARVPFHRQVWEIAPTLVFGATAITIAWSVARVATARAALSACLIVVVASPWTLAIVMAPVAHNTVYPATALLGAYVVWLAGGTARRRVATVAVPAVGAVALGLAVASDSLLIATGVIPLALTAAAAAVQRSERARLVAWSGLATVAGSVPIAIVTKAMMRAQGFETVPTSPRLGLAALSSVPGHVRILAAGLKELSNGYLAAGWPGRVHAEIGVACDVVMVSALVTVAYIGLRSTARLVRREEGDGVEVMRLLHVGFWFSSVVVVCGAFLFTTAPSGGPALKHESYYLTAIFSVAAIVPLLVRPHHLARLLVPVGLAIFATGSIIGLKRDYLQVMKPPVARYASAIVHLAEANRVTVGYAGYWDASSLTWNSRDHVLVRPLEQCPNPRGADVCPFFLMRTPSWYVPKERHTFLLVDPSEAFVTSLPRGLGRPIASYEVGTIGMYVYAYDIASRLGPAPN